VESAFHKAFKDHPGYFVAATPPSKLKLIEANLSEPRSRALMVISTNEAAKHNILQLLDSRKTEYKLMEGGLFPNDKGEQYLHTHLREIMNCMKTGKTVVLIRMNHVYECLYDVLNMRETIVGSVKYARIAVGYQRETCIVNDNFKIIVIVDPEEAYYHLPPPFLNRFEKHTLEWSDIIADKHYLVQQTSEWLHQRVAIAKTEPVWQELLIGYHQDTLYSLVATLIERGLNSDQLLYAAKCSLLWLIRPTGLLYHLKDAVPQSKNTESLLTLYTEHTLSSLTELFDDKIPLSILKCFPEGRCNQYVIFTHSPSINLLDFSISHEVSKVVSVDAIQREVVLQEVLGQFYQDKSKKYLFLEMTNEFASFCHLRYLQTLCDEYAKRSALIKRVFILFCISHHNISSLAIDFAPKWHYLFMDSLKPAPKLTVKNLFATTSWITLLSDKVFDKQRMIEENIAQCVINLVAPSNYAGTFYLKSIEHFRILMSQDNCQQIRELFLALVKNSHHIIITFVGYRITREFPKGICWMVSRVL
jgi:hypothetical protein